MMGVVIEGFCNDLDADQGNVESTRGGKVLAARVTDLMIPTEDDKQGGQTDGTFGMVKAMRQEAPENAIIYSYFSPVLLTAPFVPQAGPLPVTLVKGTNNTRQPMRGCKKRIETYDYHLNMSEILAERLQNL